MRMDVETLLSLKAAAVAGAFLAFALIERLRPAVAGPLLLTWRNRGRAALQRLGRNAGLFGLNLLVSPLLVIPITILADRWALGWRPAALEGAPGLVVDLLVLDCWIYWWHRANHVFPWLWRFHEVHHLDEHLDTTSGVRFHLGEVLLSAGVRGVVIVALGIPLTSVIIFETLVLLTALFHHSDMRLSPGTERLLSRVIVTPGIHWVHHHAIRRDTDSNYATILSIWDPLFGSRSRTRRFAGMKIGVERMRDRPLWRLIVQPVLPQWLIAKWLPRPARQKDAVSRSPREAKNASIAHHKP